MPNLISEARGRVVLMVHNGVPYSADEWRTILTLAARPDLEKLRVLFYDEGGAIDSAQRRTLVDTMGTRMPKAALLSSSPISRGITTAIGWFKPGIRAFHPNQLGDAAAYLDLTSEETAFVETTWARLLAQLDRKTG